MVDNRLKKCCEYCRFLDIKTSQEVVSYNTLGKEEDILNTYVKCAHMNVCKAYIEETEKEENKVE